MSINSNFGIPDERAKVISKEYASHTRSTFEAGRLSDSVSLKMIMEMNLTEQERVWLAYHVGGVNRTILNKNEIKTTDK